MSEIAELVHEEPLTLDRGRLAALTADLGVEEAGLVVAARLDAVAATLSTLERHDRRGEPGAVRRDARRLRAAARLLGVTALARVAGDLDMAGARGDMVAFAAIRARLFRLGGRLLATGRDAADLIG
ncbi:hypothetical protein C2I36_01995 [Rhodobacteraceae bacterium WD3A24]|nr:hypothetical protein C2I36_01995 [Rhodobacteraceae bacterium WD3A24]